MRTVGVMAFDGMRLFHLSVVTEVFGVDRNDMGIPPHEIRVTSPGGRQVRTAEGLVLEAPHSLEALHGTDLIVVPSWLEPDVSPPADVLSALREAHDGGITIAGLCTGAFVLAAAGLLDGRPATTHWLHAEKLALRYPSVKVDPAALYIDDGDVVTSAGTAAAIDLCLHLLAKAHGSDVAAAVARRMVVPAYRHGGQAQYIELPMPSLHGPDPLQAMMQHALAHLDDPLDLSEMAAMALMSPRTFTRRFRAAIGESPHQWLLQQRITAARRLLERTDLGIDAVAARCGLDGASLRTHFSKKLGVSPAAYRSSYR